MFSDSQMFEMSMESPAGLSGNQLHGKTECSTAYK